MNDATREALLKAAYLAERTSEFVTAIRETRKAWSDSNIDSNEWFDLYTELETFKSFMILIESSALPAFKVASTIGRKLEEF